LTNSVTTDSAAQPTVHDTPDVSVVTSPRREAVIIGALSLAAMIVSMMQTLPVPILGRIQSDLGASAAGISWVTTATLLSAAVFTPLLGRYGDQHGKKRTLVGVLVVMVIGSIVAALAAHTSFPARWHWSAELSHSAAGSPS
jgi:predicted MFS family arabinose efflux permease